MKVLAPGATGGTGRLLGTWLRDGPQENVIPPPAAAPQNIDSNINLKSETPFAGTAEALRTSEPSSPAPVPPSNGPSTASAPTWAGWEVINSRL